MKRIMPTLLASLIVLASLTSIAAAKEPTNGDVVAAITQFENNAVKADLAGDSSFFEKNYADNWTGGFSGGSWTTKASMLADMRDTAKNKMNSEVISDLAVRVYGNTAIATYTDTYDATIRGAHRATTVLSTDTFVQRDGVWQEVAGHSSVVAK